MSDTLYAFDADVGGAPLWSVNFATLVGAMPVPIARFVFSGNKSIVGNLGILSTPVIDPSTGIMYLVACTLESSTLAYRLHAVDITSGAEPYGPGVLISGSYGGSTFDARTSCSGHRWCSRAIRSCSGWRPWNWSMPAATSGG